jgi:ribonuclease HII
MREYEDALLKSGICYIAGVDEVGRGPLAGPVVAAAVVLPVDFSVAGVDDSKKLSAKKRETLFDAITCQALAIGTGIVDNRVIDEINILEATKLAMKEAIADAGIRLRKKAGVNIDHVLIDAVRLNYLGFPQTSIVKGDQKSVSIAAASIIAKVTRDRIMACFHKEFPFYSFDKNMGYGTKVHYEGIEKHGICEIHRKSFLNGVNY